MICGRVLVLATASPYRHIPHSAARGPVPLAVLAEMARLVDIVIVVVAEFGVHAVASRTGEDLVRFLQCFLLL